ncbi:class I SAM-dependent methyltransferase [Aeromicrobium sp. Leaf350]|uniref:class I SAM-dependent methyltransferase n=1 Tax=Aeromicrobium sp. Leaf350 TaxID=2876565 RepID=UPI001E631B98|nr:methyltransferase domain-containing protein [Aeromicrobium sp. Leaf350]
MEGATVQRMAKWLVGERLSTVLHLGDASLAYTMAEQGHDVVIAGDDVRVARGADLQYVRTAGDRLPFRADSFDAVVAPALDDSPSVLAEYARVLRPGGVVSSVRRTIDETLPWVRRLRAIAGTPPSERDDTRLVVASGMFAQPEVEQFASWEELDAAGVLQLARHFRDSLGPEQTAQVHQLVASSSHGGGTLRLRQATTCTRAEVEKAPDATADEPAETSLLDFR